MGLLSELRRREVWEKWGDLLPLEYFNTKEEKELRGALERIHQTGTSKPCKVVPNAWLPKKLQPPQPSLELSLQKVESEVITRGTSSFLNQLERRLERLGPGELLDASDPVIDGAQQWLQDVHSRNVLTPTNGNGHSPIISSKDLLREKEWEEKGTVPTYLHQGLDHYLGGGVGPGQLCVLQAAPKRGKTSLLLTIAYRAARAGKRTLFISCENFLDQLGERLHQLHQAARVGRRHRLPQFALLYRNKITISEIQAYVRDTGPYDILIVDYADRMGSSKEDDWTWKTQDIYYGLRDETAKPYNLVCWTATQEHVGASWQKSSSRQGTFGSQTKLQICDLHLGWNLQPRLNEGTFTVLGRRGRGKEGGEFKSFFNSDTAQLKDK